MIGHSLRAKLVSPSRSLCWLALACLVSIAGCSKPSPTNATADVKINVRNMAAIGSIKFAANDVFEVSVDGESIGKTPRGGTRTFYVSLSRGHHMLRLAFVERTDNEAAYSVLIDGAAFDRRANGSSSSRQPSSHVVPREGI